MSWSASIATMTERPLKITFGEMRGSGVPHPDLLRAFDCAPVTRHPMISG